MDFEPSFYVKDAELSFRYSLFSEEDTSYNLDYIDSDGDRYPQELAAVDFNDSTVPLLVSSSFYYFPAHSGYRHESDTFHGQLISEKPVIGTRQPNKLPHIRNLLATKIADHLGSLCEATHEHGYIKIWNKATRQPEGSVYVDSFDDNHFVMEVLVPTDKDASKENRHDDARFAGELWVLLHDFAANLPADLDASAAQLGRIAFTTTEAGQTLHIGINRQSDACRLGMELLQQIDIFDSLNDMPITLSGDMQINQWNERLQFVSDEDIRSICRRTLVLAQDNNGVVTQENFQDSVAMHNQLRTMNIT